VNNINNASGKLPLEFWHFSGAKLFYTLGVRMISTIVIYQVYKLSNTYMVGVAGLTEFLPAVITAMYAGHYIDTHDKKKILSYTYIFYSLIAVALAVVSFSQMQLNAHSKIIYILIAVFLTGVIRSFASPAASSMIAAIVPRAQLPKAISISSSTYLFSSITGHATGGLLIAFAGISNAYLASALLLSIASFFTFKIKSKPPVAMEKKEPMVESIKHGFRFVWTNKTLLGVISLDLFAVLFGGAVAFIPEIAENVLHTGPIGYGFLNAAMDIGALISVLILMAYPLKRKQGVKMLFAVAGFGLFIIVFGLSKIYWLSFIALALAGFCDGISVVIRGVISQLNTPDKLRGRVSSINMIFINSSNELGQFESGFTSKLMGTIPAIVFGGAMSILVVIGTWVGFPSLKKTEY
jgi:MFS family permease